MTMTLDGSGASTVGVPNRATAQNSTSGTAIDFTGIPAGIKRVTVLFNGVSIGTQQPMLIQIGAGSIETTGYVSSATYGTNTVGSTIGYLATYGDPAGDSSSGAVTLYNVSGNIWVASGVTGDSGNRVTSVGGTKTISGGTLARVRITTVNGTDTFDAGSVNIFYE